MIVVFERTRGDRRTMEYEGSEFGMCQSGAYYWLVMRSTISGKAEIVCRAHKLQTVNRARKYIEDQHRDGQEFCDMERMT